jgi:diguanylate cyclase (GGDEF)-like protein
MEEKNAQIAEGGYREMLSGFESIDSPLWVFDTDHSKICWANRKALEIWKSDSLSELCKRDMGLDMSTSVEKRLRQYQSDFLQSNAKFREQWTIYPKDEPLTMSMYLSGFRLEDGRMAMLCEGHPTSESVAPESIRSVEALLHTPVMITLFDESGIALYRNPAARESVPQLDMKLAQRFVKQTDASELFERLSTEDDITSIYSVKTSTGTQWHEMSVRKCRDAVSGGIAFLCTESNVTALKHAQAHSNHLARHDALTGLPNRNHVMQRFQAAISEIAGTNKEAALIFLDLDHFKDVNDTLGHSAGDELLVDVAHRLRSIIRSSDMVARLGGDEFLILLLSKNIRNEIEIVKQRLAETVSKPITIHGTEIQVTTSVGVAIYPHHGLDMETLLRNADLAMYSSKDRGRNALTIYESQMSEKVQTRLRLEGELREALNTSAFEVYYQPRVDMQTNQVVGAEALLRWNHKNGAIIMPSEFIEACENIGLMSEIGDFVMNEVSKVQSEWHTKGYLIDISVNVSRKQLLAEDVVDQFQKIAQSHGADITRIEIDLKESMLVGHNNSLVSRVNEFRSAGFKVSIDDFGQEFTNLIKIKSLPLNSLKMSPSFTSLITKEVAVTELLASLCDLMSFDVVALGVENLEQISWLLGKKINVCQGSFYSMPVPLGEFNSYLETHYKP